MTGGGVWHTRVRDLCSKVLSVAEREILERKWKGQIGGPRMDTLRIVTRMDTDFEEWCPRACLGLQGIPVDA